MNKLTLEEKHKIVSIQMAQTKFIIKELEMMLKKYDEELTKLEGENE